MSRAANRLFEKCWSGVVQITQGAWILAAFALLLPAVAAPTAARAQAVLNGWCTVVAAGTLQCFGTPLEACQKQWEVYSATPFQGVTPVYNSSGAENPIGRQCHWTTPPGSGASTVWLYCNNYFAPCPSQPPITCVSCSGTNNQGGANNQGGRTQNHGGETQNHGGAPAATTPRPIDILSGNEQLTAQDFSNQSHTLALNRVFNSLANAGPGYQQYPNPLGLANWSYDFQFELVIGNCCSYQPTVVVLTPDGASPSFESNGSSTLQPFGPNFNTPQTAYTLSIVGSWPSNLTAVPTTWVLTDSNDTTYTLQTFPDPVSGAYWNARPVTMTRRNGVTWNFTYGTENEVSSITDNFGNRITFTWLYSPVDGKPSAISAASLPGGFGVNYTYSTVASGTGLSPPDILTNVQYLDNNAVVQDQVSYAYASAANPYSVSGVFDASGVQRWGVSYDPNTGQALVSSSNGSVSAAVAAGSISGTTLTVSAVTSGALAVGQNVTGANVALGTVITALGTGTGGTGTYTIAPSQTLAATSLATLPPAAVVAGSILPTSAVFNGSISGTTLVVNSFTSGALDIGDVVTGAGVTAGTFIVTGLGYNHWEINNSLSVASEAMTGLPATAVATGSIGPSSTTMTVTAVSSGTLAVGDVVNGLGVTAGTTITALGTGSGGPGTYTVSPSQTASSTSLTATGGSLTVTGVTTGALAVGQSVTGSGVTAGTVIAALTSGVNGPGTYTVNVPQTVSSTTLTMLPTVTPNESISTGSIAPSVAVTTGSIGPSSTTMTVTSVASGTLAIGQVITGSGVTAGTTITAFGSGMGGAGTYTVSASQTVSSTTLTATNTLLTVTGVTAGALGVGQSVIGSGVTDGTVITALATGAGGAGTYAVNLSQTVGSTTLWTTSNAAVVTGSLAANAAVVTGSISSAAAVVTGSIAPNKAVVTGSISNTAAVVTGSIEPGAAVVTGSILPSAAVVTGSIGPSSTTMTVTAVTSGALAVGQFITGTGVASGTQIVSFGTGSGGVGTYTVNYGQTVSSGATLTSPGPTMTVTAVTSGALAVGQAITGTGVTAGTLVAAFGSGTGGTGTYWVNLAQTVASTTLGGGSPTMTVTGVTSGALAVGQGVTGSGVTAGTVISGLITGTGGTGTYVVSIPQTVASTTLTSVAPTMTVTAVTSGALAIGQVVTGAGVSTGTRISALGTGSGATGTYAVNLSQTVSSTTLTVPGPTMIVTAVTSGTVSVGDAVSGSGVSAGTIVTGLGTGTGGAGTYPVNISQTAGSTTLTAVGAVGTMSVTGVTSGALTVGQVVTGSGVASGTNIVALGTGTGATGTYIVSVSQSVASESLTATGAGATMTVTGITHGALAVGQVVTGSSVAAGTVITALGTGTGGVGAYTVTNSQSVSSTTLTAASNAGQAYQVAYLPVSGLYSSFNRTVINPLGKLSVYTFYHDYTDGLLLTGVADQASTYSPASSMSYTYGAYAFVASITDQNGNVETQTHDPRGMPEQVVEASTSASPRTTTTTWDATWHEPDTVAAPTVTTGFTYNALGAPLTKALTDNTTFTVPYATNGRTRTWTFDWATAPNQLGELLAVHGPRWTSPNTVDTTLFTYNPSGYLQSVANALGQTTTVEAWDWRGAPLTVTDPNGVVTNFTYDIHGRLLTAILDAAGTAPSEYQFAYDPVGDISQVTLPGGATVTYANDQGRRVTQVTNVRGETQSFTYDDNDDPLSLITDDATGTLTQTHSAAYDEWGRILQSIGAASQIWNLAYDNLSNLTSITDPLSHQRQNTIDPLNRVITQTDPQSATVGYAYDASNNLARLTDSRSLATTREVDGFDEVIQEVSPDRGTRSFWYDPSSNLVALADGDSVQTDFAYDDANRLTSKTFPGDTANTVTYTYDQTSGGNVGVGRLTSVTEASGSTAFTWDAQGRLVTDSKVISDSGYTSPLVVSYAYDANGKVIQITYPSGDTVDFTRTADGLITAVTATPSGHSQENIATSVYYEPFGPLAGFTYGNGLNLTRTYDQDYQLTGLEDAPTSGTVVLNLSFSWQTDGRISGVTDNASTGRGATYSYTDGGRALTGDGPWGNFTYAYDSAGNRTQLATASGVYTQAVMPGSAVVTGSISGTTLTVSAVTSGSLAVGQSVAGSGVTAGTVISALGTGTGGTGTYTVNYSQSVGSTTVSALSNAAVVTGSIASTTMTVTAVSFGVLAVGQSVAGTGVSAGTVITAFGTGTGGTGTYAVSPSQTASSTALTTSPNSAVVTGSLAPNGGVVTGSITPSAAVVTGSIASNTLTVTAVTSGVLQVGQSVTGTGVASGTFITGLGTGNGGTGTYNINGAQTVSSTTLTAAGAGGAMTVSAVTSGILTVGQSVTGSGVTSGTVITALGSGFGGTGTYTVSPSQTVSSTTLTGSGTGGAMLVSATTSGTLAVGQSVNGSGVTTGTVITALNSGTGTTGVYVVSNSQTVGSELLSTSPSAAVVTGSISGTTLTVSAMTSGTLGLRQTVTGSGVTAGTVISAFGTGTGGTGTYTLNNSQTVSSRTLAAAQTASNQLTWTADQTGALQRILTYRAGGDLFQDDHLGGTLYEYDYNALKRLVEVKQNGTQEGGYAYDFQGRRVWRQTFGGGAAQTAYVYDPQGHLLAEHNATTGAVNREYIWVDDIPVALLDISGATVTTDFIHTGQIDEPLAVTSSSKSIVWNAYVDPYGIAANIGTPTTTLDMRLPGQSFQLEADSLHQNVWRDYDPSLGRYVEGDPLGIGVGQNIYGYVDGDPLNQVDATGLASISLGAYDLFGGGVIIGNDPSPGGGVFVTFRVGAGLGGGISYDPQGGAPGKYPVAPACLPPLLKHGGSDVFGEAGLSALIFGIEGGANYGTHYAGNKWDTDLQKELPHRNLEGELALKASVVGGLEVTIFPFNAQTR
jgi:RHS repeat-associated protein